MGIIINDIITDSNNYPNNSYASFSGNINIKKTRREFYASISQEDASGNNSAIATREKVFDSSGNETLDESGNIITREAYLELRTKDVYHVVTKLVHYKSKADRLNKRRETTRYRVEIDLELNELPNIFSKLYEKVKTDKTILPFNNLTDDL